MCRISSPGPYWRCSANSTENPLNGLLWSPDITPSTTSRAISSSRPKRARAVGSSVESDSAGVGIDGTPSVGSGAGADEPGGGAFGGDGDVLEQVRDDLVGADPF